jgi:hypothetical protein
MPDQVRTCTIHRPSTWGRPRLVSITLAWSPGFGVEVTDELSAEQPPAPPQVIANREERSVIGRDRKRSRVRQIDRFASER